MYTPNCDVFWVGSYPAKDPLSASRRILRDPNVLLHWPQLPKRGKKERAVGQTYAALSTPDDDFPKGAASGWNAMWRAIKARPKSLLNREHFKTQLAGPITLFGKLQASGNPSARKKRENERALLNYVTLWLRHAYWQIDTIREKGFKPVIVLDEPLLPTYMGPAGSNQAKKTLKLLRSIVKRLKRRGAKVGIHCCNRISPSILIELEVDLIHFDAYHFPTQVARTHSDLQRFLQDGGIVAWGIVPTTETLTPIAAAKLEKDFTALLVSLEGRGLPLRRVLSQSMVSATCGTGSLDALRSEKIVSFVAALSRQLKSRYKLL